MDNEKSSQVVEQVRNTMCFMEISLDLNLVWNESDIGDTLEGHLNTPLHMCVVNMGVNKERNIVDRQ